MQKLRKIQVKGFALLGILTLFMVSCNSKNDTKEATTNSQKEIAKPKQDLHEAVLANNLKVVQQHIKAGTDLNKKEAMSGSTPLMTAITFNKPKIAAELLKAKVNLSIKNNDGSTALHTAAFFGRIEIIQLLLEAGADKTLTNNFGATPREIVLSDFQEMKPIYQMLTMQLEPMGFALDLEKLEKERPVVAMMLQ